MEFPTHIDLFRPTLDAIESLGGSAQIDEITDEVSTKIGLSPEQLEEIGPDGRRTKLEYRLAWARTYLKGMGLIDNSQRGVWVTKKGAVDVSDDQLAELLAEFTRTSRNKTRGTKESADAVDSSVEDVSWKSDLIDRMRDLSPDGFERLAQRLLRELGFSDVEVTPPGADGGIDGTAIYRPSLISWPVYFQCKRYSNSVGSGPVRDFRGAMQGRGERGVLITTSSFTREARVEASRDGAPPVDLIDGEDLCDLLVEAGIGVRPTYVPDEAFFTELD